MCIHLLQEASSNHWEDEFYYFLSLHYFKETTNLLENSFRLLYHPISRALIIGECLSAITCIQYLVRGENDDEFDKYIGAIN